ncbi:hypothetical protein Tco_1278808 [Tanacetum coccineum]
MDREVKRQFIEEPVEIINREVKRLKQSRIPIVKVRWNSKRGLEFTWERKDQMQKKYPHLFATYPPVAEANILAVSVQYSEFYEFREIFTFIREVVSRISEKSYRKHSGLLNIVVFRQ